MANLIDKLWSAHVVKHLDGGKDVLYIDCHYIHEVTSPIAFENLRSRGLSVFRPRSVVAIADHNTPTVDRHLPIVNDSSRIQLDQFYSNCALLPHFYPMDHIDNGIVHVVGPEKGFTKPGMSIVCGDSHTSTHGALAALAFGIGTSEVAMVLATNCIIMSRPASMRIIVDGELKAGVSAKDVALHIINKIGTRGAAGYFIEYAGSVVENLSVEGRMTLCNMSIECGARGGVVAADDKTFNYIGLEPYGDWRGDDDAVFDAELTFNGADIEPMITWGTNPAQGVAVSGCVPIDAEPKALQYMGLKVGQRVSDIDFDYVFVGSCTNGRYEDFVAFANVVKGYKKHESITAWLVPGSKAVVRALKRDGVEDILIAAGFELREPGCSACLAMNDDKIPYGKRSASTSNRNFEGRQGVGSRTMLCSPTVAANIAINGHYDG